MDFNKPMGMESPICRCCLSEEGNFRNLSTEYRWMSEAEVYEDMLSQCFNIILSYNSVEPSAMNKLICEICITQLRAATNFKKKVEESERKFHKGFVRKSEEDSKIMRGYIIAKEFKVENLDEEYPEDFHLHYSDDELTTDNKQMVEIELKEQTSATSEPNDFTANDKQMMEIELKEQTSATTKPNDFAANDKQMMLMNLLEQNSLNEHNAEKTKTKKATNEANMSRSKAEIVICDICKSIFNNKISLRKHLLLHKYKFCCDLCGKVFNRMGTLNRHIKTHDKNTCSKCQEKFSTYSSYLKHNEVCNPKTPKIFTCDHCSKKCRSRKVLKDHLLIHNKPFVCEACGKRFTRQSNLYQHSEVHKVKKHLSCKFCSKKFAILSRLRYHLLIHGEKKYVCDICNKSFVSKSNYERHLLLIHKKTSKPFISCNICGKAFLSKYYLDRHLPIHDRFRIDPNI